MPVVLAVIQPDCRCLIKGFEDWLAPRSANTKSPFDACTGSLHTIPADAGSAVRSVTPRRPLPLGGSHEQHGGLGVRVLVAVSQIPHAHQQGPLASATLHRQ